MDNNRRQAPFVNIGSSLLLVIFLVLCLVTFATLSLSSARSDESFSRRMADRKTEYYEAAGKAEDLLAQIDQMLEQTASKGGQNSQKTLDFSGISPEIHYDPVNTAVSYQVPINEKQALDVVLALNTGKDTAQSGYYQIEKWQTVNTEKGESDDTLNLMPVPSLQN